MTTEKVLKTLEFDKILKQLSGYAVSDVAKEKILNIRPVSDLDTANILLAETAEADKVLYEYSKNPNFAVDDISDTLLRAQKLSTLSISELLRVARLLKIARNLSFLSQLSGLKLLKEKVDILYSNFDLEERIYDSFPTDSEVSDNASTELKHIRTRIRKCNDNIRSRLNNFITSPSYSKFLQDNLVTLRGDRYVIPVKSECKGSIPGLIHDQSASGATIYVEPFAIVEMNNDLKTLMTEEAIEIERILRSFTAEISLDAHELSMDLELITDLDVIFCRAILARDQKASLPVLNDKGIISIEKGRHPLIAADKVVPTTIKVGKSFDMLLITGPNTGGKTVTLKLVGLFSIMAVCGLFIPAVYAELSLFDGIYCDIGDEQSIEQSLSTFSAHIKNVKEILDCATSRSLLLFDELGAGTDPSEGAALAVATSEYVLKLGSKAVITTHYSDLKEFSVTNDRVENASMDFDINTFAPTYNLVLGAIGASNALMIARRLGLKEEIITNALSKISAEKRDFENVLLSAETTRKQAQLLVDEANADREEAKRMLQEIKQERNALQLQREKLNDNVRRETKRLVEKSVAEAEEIIDTIRGILDKDTIEEADLFKVRSLKRGLERISASYQEEEIVVDAVEDKSELSVGDTVHITSLGKNGVVKALGKNGATINLGNVVMQIKKGDYFKVKSEKVEKPKTSASIQRNSATVAAASSEVMLLGMNVQDAIYTVDNFLAEASLHGLTEVRIVHGKGNGILRQALQNHFKGHPRVAEYRDGKYGEGERGVTIVKLK